MLILLLMTTTFNGWQQFTVYMELTGKVGSSLVFESLSIVVIIAIFIKQTSTKTRYKQLSES